ncbi:Acyl-CoA N-acyltransferase [Penicillium malachiteum]|uniref:Acyl-CoA N-acyltransferase n=1 Tax=Penicillium malachiteum TaxID=1324776 RepID=UPI0025483FCA|nr:Acyl-CoA N-acyltransferase [Penicillium malachiteum]KAJ5736916.1 Acyl-CoA N-acyltransferase [Penicillium malachiteum]
MSEVQGDSELVSTSQEPDYPLALTPRQVTLRDRVTVATLVPFASAEEVPKSLLKYLSDQFNKEIEKGDTYAMSEAIPLAQFGRYWFSSFGAVMLLGDIQNVQQTHSMDKAGANWTKICLGGFHIRPNYPGWSSHVCNGTFIVTDAARNKGVGRLMGEGYLEWAPRLGYTYAVFNLVYESNVASCRLWDSLGFKRIGRIPGGGRLKSQPGEFVDAIIYGRGLSLDGEDSVSQDRFEKIRYYLKHAKYPRGADRAEKSRLRSAATHYKLIEGVDGEPDKLMLKDKEVVSDPQHQYEIAKEVHLKQHAGINKTTAAIAIKYHWVRIKETVNRVIRDCPQCKETLKAPPIPGSKEEDISPPADTEDASDEPMEQAQEHIDVSQTMDEAPDESPSHSPFVHSSIHPNHPTHVPGVVPPMTNYTPMPLDPQIMQLQQQLRRYQQQSTNAMTGAYGHSHNMGFTNFDDAMRYHTASNAYQMMVDDGSDPFRQEVLGLMNSTSHDLQHDAELLSKFEYGSPSDGNYDFS